MEVRSLKSWNEFLAEAGELKTFAKNLKDNSLYVSDVLFRGQSNSRWPLTSTLDRKLGDKVMAVRDYHSIVLKTLPTIARRYPRVSMLDRSHSIENFHDFHRTGRSHHWLGYMAYLRHHGFPSPLLDWTTSAETAGYFAFMEPSNHNSVAVYAFIEYLGAAKGGWVSEPTIHGVGPNLLAHHRHDRQDSQYSLCMKDIKGGSEKGFFYARHEDAFARGDNDQDKLIKFEIPANERVVALSYLDEIGINAFHLFYDDDAFVRDLAFKFFDAGKLL